jgi:hypothetical protein
MIAILKIAGVSAVLAAGLVTALDWPRAREMAPKAYLDRLPETEVAPPVAIAREASTRTAAIETAKADVCAASAWPNIPRECLSGSDGAPARKAIRTITIESRDGASTSVLTRVPAGR